MYRWIELEAFGSAIFRSHIGSLVSPSNVQVYQDKEVMLYFGKFTNIFKHLATYRKKLMKEAHEKGWPLIRSMAAHFGQDEKTWNIHSQYMFGDEIMVAPVTDPSRNTYNFGSRTGKNSASLSEFADSSVRGAKVYIPANTEWVHLWSGQRVTGGIHGRYVSVDTPFGCIPVFYVPGSEHGEKLREFIISNQYDADIVGATISDVELDLSNIPVDSSGLTDESTGDHEKHPLEHLLKTSRHIPLQQHEFHFAKPVIGMIRTFEEKTSWLDWFGLSEYVSTTDTAHSSQTVQLDNAVDSDVSQPQQPVLEEIAAIQDIEFYQSTEAVPIVPDICYNNTDSRTVTRSDTFEHNADGINVASTIIFTTAILMAAVDMSSSLLHQS